MAIAVAAIMASYERAVVLRPERRSDAATCPNARAALASKGSGSKSASACWRCACRAARSSSDVATRRAYGQLSERDGGDERLVW